MLCIQEELGQLSVGGPPPTYMPGGGTSDSSQEATIHLPTLQSNNNNNGKEGGWVEGLLGCLKPVWTIIGKATAHEIKGHQGTLVRN